MDIFFAITSNCSKRRRRDGERRAGEKKKLRHDIFLQLCSRAGYERRVGTFGVAIVS